MELRELQKLKDMLSKVDQKNNQLIGAEKSIMKTFKEEYDLTSIEEVKNLLKKKKKKLEELSEEIEEETEQLIKELKKEGIIENEDI